MNRLQDHGDLSVMVPKFNEDEKCLLNKGDSNIKNNSKSFKTINYI